MRLFNVFTVIVAIAFGMPERVAAEEAEQHPEATVLEPQGSVDLRTALALALTHSPELAAFMWNLRAVEARALQAGLPPNPALRVEIEDVAGTGSYRGFDQGQATITLSQLIELGGKRAQRLRNASLERDLAGWDYETKRIDVFTATAQSFVEVLAEQQRLVLAGQAVDLAKQVVGTVSDRVQAGSSSRAELTKAEVAVAAAEIERERTSRVLAAARLRLAANWGNTEPSFERAEGDLATIHPVPALTDLRRRVAHNPDLARWTDETVQRETLLALERSKAIPDVTIGAGYRRLAGSDDDALVAEVSIPLPVFDRNQGAILEARRHSTQARAERHSAEVRLTTELSTTYEELASAHAQVERLDTAILPGAAQAFETLRAGYREGRFSYLDVLDAQRTLVAARQQRVGALADYHQAVASLERLIGGPLDPADETPREKGPIE